ncbi:C-C motif chemokine 4-like [Falco biarmicus]|uniref:C-C motif chemokine 4-like n=1 Tax=Falco peregrinus TaxID=8954 RepID=UPI000FFC17B2|nr:C-C motif chemokine 4-like [Falco peregrinus]XP_005446472.3 C-C motif chemokine 4-like [Falco cherrug]XP_037257067.1 C-C motif chemokine 4-like [Falco rusticolus]XP_056196361.1 C-C motif chemokine 4-like [Falco biarmicus]
MMHSFSFLETLDPSSSQGIKGRQQQQGPSIVQESPAATPAPAPLVVPSACSIMKVLAATLAALLLVAICSLAEAHPHDSGIAASTQKPDTNPTACCFSYTSRRVSRRFISSIYRTSSICSQPAVVLVTKKGKEMCADAKASWVQELMKHFESLEY